MHKAGVSRWLIKDQKRARKVAIQREIKRMVRPHIFKQEVKA